MRAGSWSPDGAFYRGMSEDSEASPLVCAVGHYCPAGSRSQFGSTHEDSSRKRCPPGRYGNAEVGGRMAKDERCSGPCAAGFFCNAGSTLPNNPRSTCSPGFHCPAGSVSAHHSPCPVGCSYMGILARSGLLCKPRSPRITFLNPHAPPLPPSAIPSPHRPPHQTIALAKSITTTALFASSVQQADSARERVSGTSALARLRRIAAASPFSQGVP